MISATDPRTPNHMRAFTLDSLEIPPALREDLPAPAPAEDEILVRVHASSANPVDNAIAAGMLSGMADHTFPIVLLGVAAGATVVAPALPEDEEFLRDLGVSEVLPRDGDLSGVAADALLDTVSYAAGAFDAALKDGARIASPNGAAGDGPGRANVMATAHPELLPRVGALLGALTGAHTQGKRAIRIA